MCKLSSCIFISYYLKKYNLSSFERPCLECRTRSWMLLMTTGSTFNHVFSRLTRWVCSYGAHGLLLPWARSSGASWGRRLCRHLIHCKAYLHIPTMSKEAFRLNTTVYFLGRRENFIEFSESVIFLNWDQFGRLDLIILVEYLVVFLIMTLKRVSHIWYISRKIKASTRAYLSLKIALRKQQRKKNTCKHTLFK